MQLYSTSKLILIVNLRFTNNISVIITNLEYPEMHRLSCFLKSGSDRSYLIIILSTRSYLSAFATSSMETYVPVLPAIFVYKHIY
jgi:hypothetical protein